MELEEELDVIRAARMAQYPESDVPFIIPHSKEAVEGVDMKAVLMEQRAAHRMKAEYSEALRRDEERQKLVRLKALEK